MFERQNALVVLVENVTQTPHTSLLSLQFLVIFLSVPSARGSDSDLFTELFESWSEQIEGLV